MGYLMFGTLIILLFLSFISYDLIIRRQYKDYNSNWIKDGKPIGMFFYPKGSLHIFASFRRGRHMSKLLFQTPAWMEYDKKAKLLLVLYRFALVTYILIFLSPLFFIFF